MLSGIHLKHNAGPVNSRQVSNRLCRWTRKGSAVPACGSRRSTSPPDAKRNGESPEVRCGPSLHAGGPLRYGRGCRTARDLCRRPIRGPHQTTHSAGGS